MPDGHILDANRLGETEAVDCKCISWTLVQFLIEKTRC